MQRQKLALEAEQALATVGHQRVYSFLADVTEEHVGECIETLSEWAGRNTRPVTLRICSSGGDVLAGLALYDFLTALRRRRIEVRTVALGWAASMAAVILQAGTVRLAGPNAHLVIHEVSFSRAGKTADQKDHMRFVESLQRQVRAILSSRSELSEKDVEARWKRVDWCITARQAKRLGLVDEIGVG